MGRFAEMVLPLCGRYLGADFAPEMIAAAEKRTAAYSDQAKYVCASFSELMSKPDSFFGGKFDCVIMLGVCMYINDTELVKCLTRLVDLLNDKCVMYVGDAVGLGTRLTLDQIHSDQLDSDYSAIYRTAEEYVKLYSIFTKQGFHFAEPSAVNGRFFFTPESENFEKSINISLEMCYNIMCIPARGYTPYKTWTNRAARAAQG